MCTFHDCSKVYSYSTALDRHFRKHHQGIRFRCDWDHCQKQYTTNWALDDHIKSAHLGESWLCHFNDCEKLFSSRSGLSLHVSSAHFGTRYPCGFCEKIYSGRQDRLKHLKTFHGTEEDAAEMRKKKLELRKLLAEKEAQGLCSATKSCQDSPIQGSFSCEYHQKTIDSVAKALVEKSKAGQLSASSIQTADEFSLLLQRQMIYLDPEAKAALNLLSQGFDDDRIAANSYAMDSEFYWTGEYTAMDITVERLNGEEILSTRVDLEMEIEELEALVSNEISRRCLHKVYGKSDKT